MRVLIPEFISEEKNFIPHSGNPKVFTSPSSAKPAAGRGWKIFWVFLFLWFAGFSCAQAQLIIGNPYSYSVSWGAGSTSYSGATITANVPSDFTFDNCGNVPCADVGGTVTWDVGTLLSGQSVTVFYDFTVSSCATNAITFTSFISTSSPATLVSVPTLVYSVACLTDTPTVSPTMTFTPTVTPTPTITDTPTMTFSPTNTLSPTETFSPTITFTPTNTATVTPTPTLTNTATITDTPTITNTFTVTPTFTPICVPHVWPDPFNPKYAFNGFLNLSCVPANATVNFYTVSGELVIGIPETGGLAQWNGRNAKNVLVSPGIYFYVIQVGNETKGTGKFLVNRSP